MVCETVNCYFISTTFCYREVGTISDSEPVLIYPFILLVEIWKESIHGIFLWKGQTKELIYFHLLLLSLVSMIYWLVIPS